nr:MAG TPA: hypothetical protein [Caudoviricetes sp.]
MVIVNLGRNYYDFSKILFQILSKISLNYNVDNMGKITEKNT